MKLYYAPGACSLAVHIVLCELGLPHALAKVDLQSHTLVDGSDFVAINPKGYVPALELANGQLLTELAAIVQYLADLRPEAGLLPPAGTLERFRVQEWLSFIGSELHKGLGALFNPAIGAEWKAAVLARVARRFDFVNAELEGRHYLTGSQYSVADAYLFTILRWTDFMHIDLSPWPALVTLRQRVAARPAVRHALQVEGLI